MIVVAACVGIFVGGGVAWIIARHQVRAARAQAAVEAGNEIAVLNERLRSSAEQIERAQSEAHELESSKAKLLEELTSAQNERARLEERAGRIPQLESEISSVTANLDQARQENADLRSQLSVAKTTIESERSQTTEKLALLNEARTTLTEQFKLLASDILDEKSKRFTEQNQTNLSQILEPLRTKITEFQGRVEEVYNTERTDLIALKTEVMQLRNLNQQLSDDANNLTRALKGDSKRQGDWGEMLLERILEAGGLKQPIHYEMQTTFKCEDGGRSRPDAIVHLPQNRNLIVDSKVSLRSYDQYVRAEEESDRNSALQGHLESMRNHIDSLSTTAYQTLAGVPTVDFVVMFVPIESAYILGISSDQYLWEYAMGKNVLLVGPSNLLFVVRTVAHLWRQEEQRRNVQEIADRGASLYDKFVSFVEDFQKIGERLRQADETYDEALRKLKSGRGNIIRQAEQLRELGVKPSKSLPAALVQSAEEEEEESAVELA